MLQHHWHCKGKCRHLLAAILVHSRKAGLNLSVFVAAHGPPGVGKSLTHWLAARALYNADPLADSRCPGHACTGYKVGALLQRSPPHSTTPSTSALKH